MVINMHIKSKYRHMLFPEINRNIITGYNILEKQPKSNAAYLVNYFHSFLGFDPKGRPHAHREALLNELSQFGNTHTVDFVVSAALGRHATYKLGDWDEAYDKYALYWDAAEIRRLRKAELQTFAGTIVKEKDEYVLGIAVP